MKLRGITLANFKSFAGEAEIPLGQITSLIGPNGAGKSNVFYGLQKIAAILSGSDYRPEKEDYFDDNDGAVMRLGATLELSDAEQQTLLARPKTWPDGYSPGDLVGGPLFRRTKYVVSLGSDPDQRQEVVCLSDPGGKLQPFIQTRLEGATYEVLARDIAAVDLANMAIPALGPFSCGRLDTAHLFNVLDDSLFPAVQRLFAGLRLVPSVRAIPPRVPARQSDGLSPSGDNLSNELSGLPRAEQDKFDRYMKSVTHGDPLGVEPRMVVSDLLLEVRQEGLTRSTRHIELGSGQLQTLILGWQIFRQRGTIIVVKEPELHLHAERQKQVLRLIRDKSAGGGPQFIIETHSPVFLGAGEDERTVLVTKEASRSGATEILPSNVGLIRRDLGITHADALRPASILFAEGLSDLAVFEPLLRAVAPEHAFTTMIYTLHGAHNTKNLKMLIRYLEADGRRIFVILDKDDEARRQVKELEDAGLLDDNYHFLARNLEDEFDSAMVVKAAGEMAAEAGGSLSLTAGELDGLREEGVSVATALKGRWNKGQCGAFSKVKLAERIVGLLGGEIPPGIEKALRAAVAHFEGTNAEKSRQRAARNPGAGS